jgi:hypothetical protein
MRLTSIEMAAYVAAFAGGNKHAAYHAVVGFGRIKAPEWTGEHPLTGKHTPEYDAHLAERERDVEGMFATVQAENERLAKATGDALDSEDLAAKAAAFDRILDIEDDDEETLLRETGKIVTDYLRTR